MRGWKVHPNDPIFKSAHGRLRIFNVIVDDVYLDRKISTVVVARRAKVKTWVVTLYLAHLTRLVWWAEECFNDARVRSELVKERKRLKELVKAMELGYYHLPNHPIRPAPKNSMRWRRKYA